MSRLVAHRGQKFSFPENTAESVSAAIACGATAVEFDVQMTRDHVPVICHDVTLSRTAGIDINITEVDYPDIEGVCVGEPARFNNKHQGVTLPSLMAMVAMLNDSPQVMVFVELKNESIDVFGIDCILKQVLPQLEQIKQRCVVIADNLQVLLKLKQQTSFQVGWIIHRWSGNDFMLAEQSKLDYLVINQKYCTGHVHDFTADCWQWVVYETSDPDTALALFEQGVTFVESDNVCSMLKQLTADK